MKCGLASPARLFGAVRRYGWRGAVRETLRRSVLDPDELLPLKRINSKGLFTVDVTAIHAAERESIRVSSLLLDSSRVQDSYPNQFQYKDKVLRYSLFPATGTSRGLVVLFHGHNSFLHLGPTCPWKDFDLLAPWDCFGWQRQGSWFWGEKGIPFVEEIVQMLIRKVLDETGNQKWFCMGASMGGFASLWHGIKFGCAGMYVICPQVDLAAKSTDLEADGVNNPYRHLSRDGDPETFPNPLVIADMSPSLPPLYLIQNLYDHINPFSQHAWKLLEIYNRRHGWYGLRIHPSTGHGGDGKQEEAAIFFSMILDRNPKFPAQLGQVDVE